MIAVNTLQQLAQAIEQTPLALREDTQRFKAFCQRPA